MGRVEVLAEVKVIGTYVGLFWLPPYRIDITDVVKQGKNNLEVMVTNLWPYRLLGDEHLPTENEYGRDGRRVSGILKMPDWYLKGEAKPGERIAFSTWQHFKIGEPLPESGLIGTIKLRTAFIQNT